MKREVRGEEERKVRRWRERERQEVWGREEGGNEKEMGM